MAKYEITFACGHTETKEYTENLPIVKERFQ